MLRRNQQSGPSSLGAYLWANAIAWVAFAVLFAMVGLAAGDWSGLAGFFLIFAAAFAAASVFDYLYDRWIIGREPLPDAPDGPVAPAPSGRPAKSRKTRR